VRRAAHRDQACRRAAGVRSSLDAHGAAFASIGLHGSASVPSSSALRGQRGTVRGVDQTPRRAQILV
jgi:hypothetical protein